MRIIRYSLTKLSIEQAHLQPKRMHGQSFKLNAILRISQPSSQFPQDILIFNRPFRLLRSHTIHFIRFSLIRYTQQVVSSLGISKGNVSSKTEGIPLVMIHKYHLARNRHKMTS